jgi:arylsulfatase A-like enzyme
VLGAEAGWGRGFARWSSDPRREKMPGGELRRRALRAVEAARREHPGSPAFLYLQYMEPHTPYDVPPAYRRRVLSAADEPAAAEASRKVAALEWDQLSPREIGLLRALYGAEVACVDHELARLFAALAHRRLLDQAIVVVTADHGEEFGEHGLVGHGSGLYNEELRVPLIVAGRGIPAGRVVRENVSLVDVAPTVLAFAGVPAEARFEGRSLLPLLAGAAPPVDVIAQLERTKTALDLRHHTAAIVRGDEKLMLLAPGWAAALGAGALYDLSIDPFEKKPVAMLGGPDSPAERRAIVLRDALADAERRLAASGASAPETKPLDEERRRRLRALGYVQ